MKECEGMRRNVNEQRTEGREVKECEGRTEGRKVRKEVPHFLRPLPYSVSSAQ